VKRFSGFGRMNEARDMLELGLGSILDLWTKINNNNKRDND